MLQKKAQIPIVFIFIFAVIVAGLLLIWGVSSISKVISISQDIDYQLTINEISKEVQKRINYETGSTAIKEFKTTKGINYFCFTNPELPVTAKDIALKQLMEISDNNLFILPLDAFEKTAFNLKNARGKSNPECIPANNGILKIKMTTYDNYVLVEKI